MASLPSVRDLLLLGDRDTENRMSMLRNIANPVENLTAGISAGNFSENGTTPDQPYQIAPLTNSEILTLVVLCCIGSVGVLMNSGVLAVIYKTQLAKKDYRMIYYIFITIGDWMYGIHTVLNAFCILFKNLEFFKVFAVCWNIHVTFGVTAYQWSAMCIIALIVDLSWSIKYPFSSETKRKALSKIYCIASFLAGICITGIPFLIWNDAPSMLPFCSIAVVYGKHWPTYELMAVVVLTVLLSVMCISSLWLLYVIYRAHRVYSNRATSASRIDPTTDQHRPDTPAPSHLVKRVINTDDIDTATNNVKDVDNIPEGIENKAYEDNDCDRVHVIDLDRPSKPNAVLKRVANDDSKLAKVPKDATTHEDKRYTLDEQKHKEFVRACRTVGLFVAVYVGSCGPYFIWMSLGVACGDKCAVDTPGERTLRALVGVSMYLLPVLDPILYIRRFDLFKSAALKCVKSCFRCSNDAGNSDTF